MSYTAIKSRMGRLDAHLGGRQDVKAVGVPLGDPERIPINEVSHVDGEASETQQISSTDIESRTGSLDAHLGGDKDAKAVGVALGDAEGVLVREVVPHVDGHHVRVPPHAQHVQQVPQRTAFVPVHLQQEACLAISCGNLSWQAATGRGVMRVLHVA